MKELPLILLKENYSKSSPINQNFLEYSMIQLVRERERERDRDCSVLTISFYLYNTEYNVTEYFPENFVLNKLH